MPFIRRAFEPPEKRSRRMPSLSSRTTAAGVDVTGERSLQIGAVYSCVRLLSEAVAGLPVGMFERGTDAREPIEQHPILSLIKDDPNPVIDAGELWRTVMGWMLLRGNGYVFVERNGSGRPVGLWPVSPSSTTVRRTTRGLLAYEVYLQPSEWAPVPSNNIVQAENMLHFRAFGLGVEGLSPVGLARQSVGIAFAAQQYMGGFYERDASPGGRIQVPNGLSDEQFERMEKQWEQIHRGFDKSHQLAVLEGGATWEQTTLSPQDAQFIETQKFTRGEIASIYGVPPHMIGDTEKSTSWGSGIAEQGIGFVTYSLRPWLNRLERVTRRLLTDADAKLRFRWNVDGLMQGDTKSRYSAYFTGKQGGWLSTNDVRRKEDMPPIAGGDEYLQPLNMSPAGQFDGPRAPALRDSDSDAPPADKHASWVTRNRQTLVHVFEEQRDEALNALRTGGTPLDRDHWDGMLADTLMDSFVGLSSEVANKIAADMGGSYDPARAKAYLESASARQATNINISTQNAIDRAIESAGDDDPADDVNAAFDEAAQVRSGLTAAAIVDQVGNFGRHEGAAQSGAVTKTWNVTSGNPRSSHAAMNGETVGIDDVFSNGAKWPHDPEAGASETAGCDCTLSFNF